jgi:hypothetical protein
MTADVITEIAGLLCAKSAKTYRYCGKSTGQLMPIRSKRTDIVIRVNGILQLSKFRLDPKIGMIGKVGPGVVAYAPYLAGWASQQAR